MNCGDQLLRKCAGNHSAIALRLTCAYMHTFAHISSDGINSGFQGKSTTAELGRIHHGDKCVSLVSGAAVWLMTQLPNLPAAHPEHLQRSVSLARHPQKHSVAESGFLPKTALLMVGHPCRWAVSPFQLAQLCPAQCGRPGRRHRLQNY